MNRWDVLNKIAERIGAETYLEIGVQDSFANFDKINVLHKVGVDPEPRTPVTHEMTSDDYFKQYNDKFDLIFIDGLHLCEQVAKDIQNAIRCLTPKGVIVLHDTVPVTDKSQSRQMVDGAWMGDVWKVLPAIRSRNFEYFTVPEAAGMTVIINAYAQKPFVAVNEWSRCDWNYYQAYRKHFSNFTSFDRLDTL